MRRTSGPQPASVPVRGPAWTLDADRFVLALEYASDVF